MIRGVGLVNSAHMPMLEHPLFVKCVNSTDEDGIYFAALSQGSKEGSGKISLVIPEALM